MCSTLTLLGQEVFTAPRCPDVASTGPETQGQVRLRSCTNRDRIHLTRKARPIDCSVQVTPAKQVSAAPLCIGQRLTKCGPRIYTNVPAACGVTDRMHLLICSSTRTRAIKWQFCLWPGPTDRLGNYSRTGKSRIFKKYLSSITTPWVGSFAYPRFVAGVVGNHELC